jgi:hypothetical protein
LTVLPFFREGAFLMVLLFFAGAFIRGDDDPGVEEPAMAIGSPPPRPYSAR